MLQVHRSYFLSDFVLQTTFLKLIDTLIGRHGRLVRLVQLQKSSLPPSRGAESPRMLCPMRVVVNIIPNSYKPVIIAERIQLQRSHRPTMSQAFTMSTKSHPGLLQLKHSVSITSIKQLPSRFLTSPMPPRKVMISASQLTPLPHTVTQQIICRQSILGPSII
jgi:hypothetical protein